MLAFLRCILLFGAPTLFFGSLLFFGVEVILLQCSLSSFSEVSILQDLDVFFVCFFFFWVGLLVPLLVDGCGAEESSSLFLSSVPSQFSLGALSSSMLAPTGVSLYL